MRGYNIGINVVRRVLYGAEIVNCVGFGHDYHTRRVLTRSLLYLRLFHKRCKAV